MDWSAVSFAAMVVPLALAYFKHVDGQAKAEEEAARREAMDVCDTPALKALRQKYMDDPSYESWEFEADVEKALKAPQRPASDPVGVIQVNTKVTRAQRTAADYYWDMMPHV